MPRIATNDAMPAPIFALSQNTRAQAAKNVQPNKIKYFISILFSWLIARASRFLVLAPVVSGTSFFLSFSFSPASPISGLFTRNRSVRQFYESYCQTVLYAMGLSPVISFSAAVHRTFVLVRPDKLLK